jgi:hypothetical protein
VTLRQLAFFFLFPEIKDPLKEDCRIKKNTTVKENAVPLDALNYCFINF